MRALRIGMTWKALFVVLACCPLAYGKGGTRMKVCGWNESASRTVATAPANQTSSSSTSTTSSGYQATAYSFEPSAESKARAALVMPFRGEAGGMATVVKDEAKLMCGSNVVGTVPKGTRITIQQVTGDWAWTSVESGGRNMSGWLAFGDLGPVAKPAPAK